MKEKLEKQEDITLCENCRYLFTKTEAGKDICCPECGEWGRLYGTKITTSIIYIKE